MIDAHVKAKALLFRQQGLTMDDIAERLSLPRTTVYSWIRDIPITRTEKQLLAARAAQTAAQKIGTEAMQSKCASRRQAAYDQAFASASRALEDRHLRDFVVLYMAEGYRRNRNTVSLNNSNPAIISLAHGCIKSLSANKLDYGVQYHVDQDLDELLQFWADLLKIDMQVIRLMRKSNSGQLKGRNWRSVHGVMQVRTCDTLFRSQLQAWMDYLTNEWQNGM